MKEHQCRQEEQVGIQCQLGMGRKKEHQGEELAGSQSQPEEQEELGSRYRPGEPGEQVGSRCWMGRER